MSRRRRISRRPSGKQSNKKILLLCEGETEKNYFEMMKKKYRKNTINIKIEVAKKNCVKAIEQAEAKRSSGGYDVCYVVMDKDNCEVIKLSERLKKYEGKVKLLLTNHQFELWLNLHFQPITGSRSSKQLCSMLERSLKISSFSRAKGQEAVLAPLRDLVHNAMSNAIQCNYTDEHKNPYTNIHTYYREIFNLSESEKI